MVSNLLHNKKEIEKELSSLSFEQLIKLEEIIVDVMKKKLVAKSRKEWKKDFMQISEWKHLDDKTQVKVDKWKVEMF